MCHTVKAAVCIVHITPRAAKPTLMPRSEDAQVAAHRGLVSHFTVEADKDPGGNQEGGRWAWLHVS